MRCDIFLKFITGAEDVPQRPLLSMYGNGISGSVPSDYYYEDSQLRGRFPQVSQDLRRVYNNEIFRMNQVRSWSAVILLVTTSLFFAFGHFFFFLITSLQIHCT